MKRIKRCPICSGFAKLRKVGGASYVVVCSVCGASGERVWLDENHTLCEIQNIAIAEWNGGAESARTQRIF